MTSVVDMDLTAIRERLTHMGQAHVLRSWSVLSDDQQRRLYGQLESLDFEAIADALQRLKQSTAGDTSLAAPVEPLTQYVPLPRHDGDRRAWSAAAAAGESLLRSGKVAAIVVAGGQGTRLGFPHPKGMFPIGPVSRKSLFELFAEQVLARSRRYGAAIPYLVMTSDITHEPTQRFFEEKRFFGLSRDDVAFVRQGNMPAIDRVTGRWLMSEPDGLALSPDGHGGLVAALERSGWLGEMRERGVEYLFYHQVDNPLLQVCDPAFLGFHLQEGAEVSTKVVRKQHPGEKMGVVVESQGQQLVIEYSDLSPEQAAQTDSAGALRYWAGNIAAHVFSRTFVERLAHGPATLPWHMARKKVPYLDDSGQLVSPASENAIKFEKFVFDVLPMAQRSLVVETDRNEEFHPLKNERGEFSPDDVRGALSRRGRRWLAAAGCDVPDSLTVEISPLLALEARDCDPRRWPRFDFGHAAVEEIRAD